MAPENPHVSPDSHPARSRPQTPRDTEWRKNLCIIIAPLLLPTAAGYLFYVFAFASMVDPSLGGFARWREILSRMFFSSDAGASIWAVLAVGTALGSFVFYFRREAVVPAWWILLLVAVSVGPLLALIVVSV